MNKGHTIIIIQLARIVGKSDKVVGKITHTHAGNDLLSCEWAMPLHVNKLTTELLWEDTNIIADPAQFVMTVLLPKKS